MRHCYYRLMETDEERKARLEKMVATKRLMLAMETDEERKERLEKMVAIIQLRLALETEEERRAKKKKKKKKFGLRLEFPKQKIPRNELACPVMEPFFLVKVSM